MAGVDGAEAEVVVPERVEAEPGVGPQRLKTLAGGGLEYLGLIVEWATGVLKPPPRDGEVDPLAEFTPKQKIDAARTGVVAAIELAGKQYPKLSQSRTENLDIVEMAKALMAGGGVTPEAAEKRLAEIKRDLLPGGRQVRAEVLAGAKAAEGGGDG